MHKFPMYPMQLKYKGIFDLNGIYNLVWNWLLDRKYDPQEDKYKNKPMSPWGYEHEIKISGEKKVDAYYMYKMRIILHAYDATDVEIGGKPLMNGRIWITIESNIIVDYSKKFERSNFTKWLEKIYISAIIDKDIDLIHADAMHYRMHNFQQEIKKFLNMYTKENYYKGA